MRVEPAPRKTSWSTIGRAKRAASKLRRDKVTGVPRWEKIPSVLAGQFGEALPPVGKSIKVRAEDVGFSFEITAQVRIKILALVDIDEQTNTFEVVLEVGLSWDVSQHEFEACAKFWHQFRPKVYFENAESSSLFDVPTEHGVVLRRGAETKRHFEYKKRTRQRFRKPLDLMAFPFDSQTLTIELYAEPLYIYGCLFRLALTHGQKHVFARDADCVDDMRTYAVFGLAGNELIEEDIPWIDQGTKLEPNRYVFMIFASRRAESTVFNIYLPLCLMFILSFIAYFVPPCAIYDRASVTLTLFLSVIALKTYMSDRLPKVPYTTAVETFLLLVSFTLLCQSCLMMAAAAYCIRYGARGQLGLEPDAFEDFSPLEDDWDCKTGLSDEGRVDFWCLNRRVRMQNVVDTAGIAVSALVGLGGVLNVAYRYVRLWLDKYQVRQAVVRYKHSCDDSCQQRSEDSLRRNQSPVIFLRWRRAKSQRLEEEYEASSILYAFMKAHCIPGRSLFARRPSSPDDGEDSRKQKANAVTALVQRYHRRAYGYGNAEFVHEFQRSEEVPASSANSGRPSLDEIASTESRTTIMFDCGTGETKALMACLVDRVKVRIVQIDMFAVEGKNVTMEDLCRSGDTVAFVRWLTYHVHPTFDFEVTEEHATLADVYGFEPVHTDKQQRGGHLMEAKSEDRLISGLALCAVNGRPFDTATARECQERAKKIARAHFRNPLPYDRVMATGPHTFEGSAVLDESATPLRVALGSKGTVRARFPDDGVETLGLPKDTPIVITYHVVWDVEPARVCVVRQRRYQTSHDRHGSTTGLLIKPINQVRIECVRGAEVGPGPQWHPPRVVVGTGAWFRNSRGVVRERAEAMFETIRSRHPSWYFERNTDLDECWYEMLSVEYAYKFTSMDPPDAVLAVGGGSTQYACIVAPDVRDRIAWRDSPDANERHGYVRNREWGSHDNERDTFKYLVLEPTDNDDPYRYTTVDVLPHQIVTTARGEAGQASPRMVPCLLQNGNTNGIRFFEDAIYHRATARSELAKVSDDWHTWCNKILKELAQTNNICRGLPKNAACISACWYAAEFVDLGSAKGATSRNNTVCVLAKTAKDVFAAELRRLIDLVDESDGNDETLKLADVLDMINAKRERDGKTKKVTPILLSNLTYQVALIDALFTDETQLRYCREWLIQGEKFRTTWSAGFYLSMLRQDGALPF